MAGLLCAALLQAQTYEKSRKVRRSFPVYSETSLELFNKYGNIHLFPWEHDSVRIDIELSVRANKPQKVDNIYDYIDFEFSSSKFYIIARTTFRNEESSFWTELGDLASSLFSSGSKTQIDYFVYMPADIDLKVTHKFGNIYMSDHSGRAVIILSNGDLKANRMTGQTEIDISFGKASFREITRGKASLNYGELELEETADLVFDTKSSEIDVESAGKIRFTSRRDTYRLERVDELNGECSFSYIHVNDLGRSSEITSSYGELNFRELNGSFRKIDISSRYSGIYLGFRPDAHCMVDIEHSRNTTLEFPAGFATVERAEVDTRNDKYRTAGKAGSGTGGGGTVNIRTLSGNVRITEK